MLAECNTHVAVIYAAHLIDQESNEESLSLLATYLGRTYYSDKVQVFAFGRQQSCLPKP
jgi:hypothetical protein